MSPHAPSSFIHYFATFVQTAQAERKKDFVQFITLMRDDEQNMTNENA